jgi:hypothetical protein
MMNRLSITLALIGSTALLSANPLTIIKDIEPQPFTAQVRRLIEATDYVGVPFAEKDKKKLENAVEKGDIAAIQEVLDGYCLFGVHINPEMRVKVETGPAKPELVEQGWRQFLVKVQNQAGTTAALEAVSPNAQSVFDGGWANNPSDKFFKKRNQTVSSNDLWLDLMMLNSQPMTKTLSGLGLEYRVLQLYSRDAGKREARIGFNVGQGTQDIGYRNEVDVLFDAHAAHDLKLRVQDEKGKPTTASFLIRDARGRVYPSQAKRLAPDFGFHPQIYRADGETIKLPEGEYTIEFSRGPESIPATRKMHVSRTLKEAVFKVERWIDPSTMGWWSGDHHIHAAGCAHYVKPTEGVHADDMIRHCMGEDLKIGANLTWGPCFDYQKQFFCGTVDKVSQYPYLLRYDIEVSGFGSHESGHLCLLRLRDQMYPGGDSKHHWPKLGLNTLKWAKKQGAVTGPAHTGWGLQIKGTDLPSYEVPPFDGIGGNEYIVDVTHEVPGPDGKLVPAVDFLSMVDTPYVWELNLWYHTLNAGFRTRVSGETDFPCIYGEKVGLGRSYVKLDGKLDYDQWCEEIRNGRNYVSDGKSHLIAFKANDVAVGEKGSELKLAKPGKVKLSAQVAAYLPEKENPEIKNRRYDQKPYWDIERARMPGSRKVMLEALVNGKPVAREEISADGKLRDVAFDVDVPFSGWVALRILPSSHTNPIFVLVDDKPIRASRRSIEWCLKGVDQCWSQKERFLKGDEKDQGRDAYAHARRTYERLLAEAQHD